MENIVKTRPPYLGVAYYPEDWDEREIKTDIEKMHEYGINTVRIGEFAWHVMEPQPGRFDFSFFHRVVDMMGEAGIAVVMCTPSATPPIWFARTYPDALSEKESGRRANHGGRRHCCSNHPEYVYYSERIARRLAQEFGRDPNVIGWQIDNEIYSGDLGCCCDNCLRKFQQRLRDKYGDIDALNEAWNLNVFSQWYDDFSEIPVPRDAWHNPHILQEWRTFQNDSHIEFIHKQARAMREYTDLPIGTDSMPVNGMDYRKMTSELDIVEFNHYNEPGNMHRCIMWMDYLRTLKERPFWNTETSTCWNGSTCIHQSVKPDGFCVANSWLPIALGGEANMYWLWRTHWAGHELMHGAVIDASGRPMYSVGEVKQTAESYRKAADFINGTKVSTDVALHFTSTNWNMFAAQPMIENVPYGETMANRFFKPIMDAGLCPDVIDTVTDLSAYKLLFSPMMLTLDENGLPERIREWVEAGGTWVTGPMTDMRNDCGARYKDRPYGMLEELTGAKWLYNVPDSVKNTGANWHDGASVNGGLWYEVFEPEDGALATITAGHSALVGKSIAFSRKVGKGNVIVLGFMPEADDMRRVIELAVKLAKVKPVAVTGGVVSARRAGNGVEGLMLVEYEGKHASFTPDCTLRDALTGETVSEKIELKPFDVKVFIK